MAAPAIPTPDPTADKPPHPRRWIPVSVRLFAAILAILGMGGTWVGVQCYRQQLLIQEIERYGGQIGGQLGDIREFDPTWLRNLVGEDRMRAVDEIHEIYFHADSATVYRRLSSPRFMAINMTTLDRHGPSIDDCTLACIAGFPKLKRLSLRMCDVGDAGMEHLIRVRDLEDLDLFCTDVTDAGLIRLKELRNLQAINLRYTDVTDSGVAELQRALPGLKTYK